MLIGYISAEKHCQPDVVCLLSISLMSAAKKL